MHSVSAHHDCEKIRVETLIDLLCNSVLVGDDALLFRGDCLVFRCIMFYLLDDTFL